jgi:hypothetical protein
MFGRNVPMVDIDFLAAEFDNLEPVAIIDYKCGLHHPAPQDAGMKVLGKFYTADGNQLPFYVVRYEQETTNYTIEPRNEAARRLTFAISIHPRVISQDNLNGFLHNLRKRRKPRVGQEGRTI